MIKSTGKARRGRPTRAEASAKLLLGIDPNNIDPRAILAEIAADRSAPAAARVAACRALMVSVPKEPAGADREKMDAASSRAISLLSQLGGRPN
jgi:hypothetical protein